VLLYHSVASGESNPYLDTAAYISHMDMLQSEFRVIGAEEFLWHLKKLKRFAPRSVLVTFDDGFQNNYTVVHPIMEQRQLPWILFTPTQSLEDSRQMLWGPVLRAICLFTPAAKVSMMGQSWPLGNGVSRTNIYKQMTTWVAMQPAEKVLPALQTLTAAHWDHVPKDYAQNFCSMIKSEQLYDLGRSSLVEIGCHTKTHPFLPSVSDKQLTQEIDEATQQLSDVLGRRVRMFAYPSGCYGARELNRIAALNFDCAFAVVPLLDKVSKYEIPRVGIYAPTVSKVRAKSLGLSSLLRSLGIKSG